MSSEKFFRVTEEERKAIRESYNRTDGEIEEEIVALKEWLRKQPHLPQDEDENTLRSMLFHNKFSLEKTKNKLDVYYSARHLVPEYYIDRAPECPTISRMMDETIMFPLPNLTPELHRVYFFRVEGDGSNYDAVAFFNVLFSMMDIRMMYDKSLGDRYIIDMRNAKLGHMVHFTPSLLKKSYELMRKAYSDKIAGMHVLNMPGYASPLVSILNSVLSTKMANRVCIHKDQNELVKILSPKVLPNEYGGTAGDTWELYNDWRKFFNSKNDWLKELGQRKSDESKRIGKPLDTGMFGMEGSFRKLIVD